MQKTKKQGTIADMQELARQKGGRCLSERYEAENTKMVWQCASGHIWETRPLNIRKGYWCSICARVKRQLWNRQTPR